MSVPSLSFSRALCLVLKYTAAVLSLRTNQDRKLSGKCASSTPVIRRNLGSAISVCYYPCDYDNIAVWKREAVEDLRTR